MVELKKLSENKEGFVKKNCRRLGKLAIALLILAIVSPMLRGMYN
jgi:hypothetical protein